MDWERLDPLLLDALDSALGYLNLGSGSEDVAFLRNLNLAWSVVPPPPGDREGRGDPAASTAPAPWDVLVRYMESRLQELQRSRPAFQTCQQAIAALSLVRALIPEYRQFHRVLLQHLPDSELINPFLLGRFLEAILRQGPPWNEPTRIVAGAITQLNDFVGHRPVPNLEGHSTRPYPHELMRPVPIFIRGVGSSNGPYQQLIDCVMEILAGTDPQLLELVQFDPRELHELAFDPRSYDFDHPVHRRPGYQFGEWDPHAIGESKHYNRFVIRKEMLDIVLRYMWGSTHETERAERLQEAAAVTTGSILVAAGIGGRGPEAYDSNTTLGTLIPILGRCRDAFYVHMLARVQGEHGVRLRQLAEKDGQPFNTVRQHLNESLARRNAVQKVRLKLSEVFAQLGYAQNAHRQLDEVPVASARVRGDIACLLTQVRDAIDGQDLPAALTGLTETVRRLREGIDCGVLVDPRNLLGFDCQFSLFPALENSVFDHRVETLLEIIHDIFRYSARVWSEAAAADNLVCVERAQAELQAFAEWWHSFAAHEVQSIDGESALVRLAAARDVADVVRRWVQSGAASGDVAFWAPHAETFRSAQAYVQVIDVLLRHRDHVASMGLLMHWISNEVVALERSEASFGQLAHRWLRETLCYSGRDGSVDPVDPPTLEAPNWALAAKFFDFLEANSGPYWESPILADEVLDPQQPSAPTAWDDPEAEDEIDEPSIYTSAYGEDFVYQDTTNDGIDSSVFEPPTEDDDRFDMESDRLAARLLFLYRVAGLWKTACMACTASQQLGPIAPVNPLPDRFSNWIENSRTMRDGLDRLSAQLQRWRLPEITEDYESLARYDHRRVIRDSLLEQTVATITALREAEILLRAYTGKSAGSRRSVDPQGFPQNEAIRCLHAIFSPQAAIDLDTTLQRLTKALRGKHLIHTAIHRGGSIPQAITAHTLHAFLRTLVWHLPRLGHVGSTCQLLEALRRREGRAMGQAHTISHFNRLFELACRSIFETTARSAQAETDASPQQLCDKIEAVAESLLISWVRYSRSLRLSAVERFVLRPYFEEAKYFIRTYGHDLFTKDKLDLGVLRGILHQGVPQWFAQLKDRLPESELPKVLRVELEPAAPQAIHRIMTTLLEAFAENFDEYTEYHATTSKADRGELTYVLLDFLRLRCEYHRVAWNLWPFVLAHSAIVQQGLKQVAQLWESRLANRVRDRAAYFLSRLQEMEDQYGVALPSVRETIQEQFVRPLQVNYLLGHARAVREQVDGSGANAAFTQMEGTCERLIAEVTGAHRNLPEWLERISRLVQPDDAHRSADLAIADVGNMPHIPPPNLDSIVDQVQKWRATLPSLNSSEGEAVP